MTFALRYVVPVIVLLAAGGTVQAQNSACQNVRFSDDVLTRFPGASRSCLDVITRDGQQYAVFKAQLEEVRGNSLRVRIKNPDGSYGQVTSIKTSPGRKVLIDGKPYSISELAPDQELTAYVRVDQPYIAIAPATESERVDAAPMEDAQPTRVAAGPTMPHTASPIGAVALLGEFSLAVALALMLTRLRQK